MKNRHTISYLSNRLSLAGAKPQRRFGQNFLIDINLIELIAKSAELTKDDIVLEVGTGAGSLTCYLAEQAGHVVTVEVDPFMQRIATDELSEFDNVTLLSMDALQSKHEVNPGILETIARLQAERPGAKWKLVANLPYNIATPLIANLFALPNPPSLMVVTIQLELAERIIAPESTGDYGSLSVWIQSQADCAIVRKLPPQVFWPKPNVDSAVLKIVPNQTLGDRIGNRILFQEFIKAMFMHRRKTLRSQLSAFLKAQQSTQSAEQIMERMALATDARAEQLNISQWIEMFNQLGL